MKKVLPLILALLIALTVSACSSKSNDGYNPITNTGQSTSGGEAMSKHSDVRVKLTFNNEEVIVILYEILQAGTF